MVAADSGGGVSSLLHLPEGLIRNIVSFLPFPDLLRLRVTNKCALKPLVDQPMLQFVDTVLRVPIRRESVSKRTGFKSNQAIIIEKTSHPVLKTHDYLIGKASHRAKKCCRNDQYWVYNEERALEGLRDHGHTTSNNFEAGPLCESLVWTVKIADTFRQITKKMLWAMIRENLFLDKSLGRHLLPIVFSASEIRFGSVSTVEKRTDRFSIFDNRSSYIYIDSKNGGGYKIYIRNYFEKGEPLDHTA